VAGVESQNYGKLTYISLEPIEKAPLYHFHPGAKILSIGSFGCNLRCPWCSNFEISMAKASQVETRYTGPADLLDMASGNIAEGNIGVAFTYNEPLIGYEYVRDTSALLHERGLFSIVATNGYIRTERFTDIVPYIDAMVIDMKSINKEYYPDTKSGLDTVLQNIRLTAEHCHLELSCLLINGINDSEEEMECMTEFIASVSTEIPFHIARFIPCYRTEDWAPTRIETMQRFEDIAKRKLKHVYLGGVGIKIRNVKVI